MRVTSAGPDRPQARPSPTWIAFGLASLCGIYLATVAGPVILLVGVLSIAAGVLYTGGPPPYGYAGMGELFVFLFFGLVAVHGSYYGLQLEEPGLPATAPERSVGFLSTAILVVNNVRDLKTDKRAGKRTLAVRLGRERTRTLFGALVVGAFVLLPIAIALGDGPWLALIAVGSLPLAFAPLKAVRTRTDGPALNGALPEDRQPPWSVQRVAFARPRTGLR